jgi:hypothetical protein
MRLVSRDALRDRLENEMIPEDTQIASYILRSAYNDCRDEGTEPASREMYGALTEKERAMGFKRGPITDPRVIWDKDTDKWRSDLILDIKDTGAQTSSKFHEDALYFEECWEKIEDIIKKKKPHSWKRYVSVLRLKAEGARVKDIAEAEKLTPYRAASILSQSRRFVKNANKMQLLSFLYY